MSAAFEIRKATRQGVKPLIGLFSESGCGKTYSSLLLARGLVGPDGKIVMIDTESGRGSLYADVLPGGYDVLELREPFSPDRYIEAVQAVEKSGVSVGILDSGSHEWEGLGGVLDMAAEREAKSGKPGLHNWREPKMAHAKFMLKLLQSPIPWIICLRAKYKTKQTKNAQGRTEIVKDDYTTPIQADDFVFEMTAHGEILQDHTFRLTKCSHPSLRQAMPNNEPMAVRHGEMLAAWCAMPTGPGNQSGTVSAENGEIERKRLKSKLWKLTESRHGGKLEGLEIWLIATDLMNDAENLSDLPASRLSEIIAAVPAKLQGVAA